MRFPISHPNSVPSYFSSKILRIIGLASIVAIPVCFTAPAHANDFYRSNYQSNHRNSSPLRGRVIINFPSQQRTTETRTIIQVSPFGYSRDDRFRDSRDDDRFFGQRYNNVHIERDRYDNNQYDNNYDNNRNVQVIRIYNDRDSQGVFLQPQYQNRSFDFSVGSQVGTTEIRRFPIVHTQHPHSPFPFHQFNHW